MFYYFTKHGTIKTRIYFTIANIIDGLPARYFDALAPIMERLTGRAFNDTLHAAE